MIPVDQLIASSTPEQVLAILYQIADTLGLATTAWQKLSPLRTIFSALSYLFSGFSRTQAAANRGAFLETATDLWLTMLAYFVYGVARVPATYAAGNVAVSNAGGGLYTFGIGDLVVLNTTTGKSYANTAPVTISPLASNVIVAVTALEVGSASNATPGQIDDFVSASPQLSVTNTAGVLGDDEEIDAALRVRCTDKLGALSPDGPAKAYAYFAKTPSLNGGVAVSRVVVLPALGNGTIRVVVASITGPISGTTGDPSTDLGKIFLALNQLAVTAGYTLLLSSASAHSINGNATIYVATSSGLSTSDAQAKAAFAELAYVAHLPIGGIDVGGGGSVLYRGLEAAIKAADPGILEVRLASEADVLLTATEVATVSSPTFTVQQVDA